MCISFSSPARIYSFDLKTGKKETVATFENFPYGDGIQIKNGNFICSAWGDNYSHGKVFIYNSKTTKTHIILDDLKGPADIFLDDKGNIIIPLMSENKIVIKKLKL